MVSPAAVICFASVIGFSIFSPSVPSTCSFTCPITVVYCVVIPCPNAPAPFHPTLHTVLSSFINTVWSLPDAISFTPYNTLFPSVSSICVGNAVPSALFVPNCPFPLLPTLHTLPSASNIDICSSPVDIWIIFDTFCIFTGYGFASSPVPLFIPNCPYLLYPHEYTLPSAVSACDVWSSDAICTIFCKYPTPFSPFTLWNLVVLAVVPSPNCPLLLNPDAHTVPSFLNINV